VVFADSAPTGRLIQRLVAAPIEDVIAGLHGPRVLGGDHLTATGRQISRNTKRCLGVHEQNLAHYRRLLTEASVMVDEARHRLLLKLLADEEAKDRLPLAERRIDPPL
jgi:hypothetical protein